MTSPQEDWAASVATSKQAGEISKRKVTMEAKPANGFGGGGGTSGFVQQ